MYTYTYTLLRYVHDATTGEFVNVGVAIFSPKARFVGALCRKTYGRVAKVFPGLDADSFKSSMRFIESRFKELGARVGNELPLGAGEDVLAFAKSILPMDDSSLQWSPFGGGVTNDPKKTLNSLFERMIQRYDGQPAHEHRTEDEIWRDFRRELDTRNLSGLLEPKTIGVQDDEIEFKHAWKNGVWHCVEPVSFDLSSADSIRDKAHRWLGQMTSVHNAAERFKVYFLVGEPQNQQLRPAFESALSILQKAPVDKALYLERDVSQLSDVIEDEVRAHRARVRPNTD